MLFRSPAPLRSLLEALRARTGSSVVLNTSLNVAGKPLAAHPDHAAQVFADSLMDALVVGDRVVQR